MHARVALPQSIAFVALIAACSETGVGTVARAPDAAVMDTAPAEDVTPPQDVPSMDAPEVAARCASDAACVGDPGGPVCDTAAGRCVPCTVANDRCPADQHCDPSSPRCVAGCRSDDGCATGGDAGASRRVCDPAAHACVECLRDEHCAPGNLCVGNTCAPGCSPARGCGTGQSCCGGACADTQRSLVHCGACDVRCASANATAACVNGACAVGACNEGYGDCDGDAANGCETDTRTSTLHCGVCGRRCDLPNATAACAAGSCAVDACATGYGDCDGNVSNGCEVGTTASRAHCGACGRACAAGQVCAAGTCVGGDGPLTVAAGARRVLDDLGAIGVVTAVAGPSVSTAQAGNFRVGQEALLINLQGTSADVGSVGRHEFVEVAEVRDGAVVLARPPTLGYGNGGTNADLSGQRVFLVRVPHFTTVVVDGTLTTNAWAGTTAGLGLVVFRASESVTVGASGVIEASAIGYRSNGYSCNGVTGRPGEAVAPPPALTPGECYYEPPTRAANRGGGGGGLSDCNRYACDTQLIGASGGGAGFATAGTVGADNGTRQRGGEAGGTYGDARLDGWFLGSGGGTGAGGYSGPGAGTAGGHGGGLVFIDAPALTVRGLVSADGLRGGDNANCSLGRGSGSGGGGSGGTIYLSGATLALTGSTVRALGAPGGCLGGGVGGSGRIRVDCGTLDGRSCAGLADAATSPPAFVGTR